MLLKILYIVFIFVALIFLIYFLKRFLFEKKIETETETETKTKTESESEKESQLDNNEYFDSEHADEAYVYMDFSRINNIKDPLIGRVEFKIYKKDAPKASLNFIELCKTKMYKDVEFHRVIKDFMIQGGDIVNGNGTGVYSIYGGKNQSFEDDPFVHRHKKGVLSMANSGPNTNGSQFFIATGDCNHLDGKHVVFGEVTKGYEFVEEIENELCDMNDKPLISCYISDCGLLE